MPDEPVTDPTDDGQVETSDDSLNADSAPQDEDLTGKDADPETLRKMLKAARHDAANYRVRLRETKENLDNDYISRADHDTTKAALSAEIDSLNRRLVARDFNIPDIVAGSITGSTPEEMAKSAKSIADAIKPAKFTPLETESPGGGLDPTRKPRKEASWANVDLLNR
ncbi:Uncharacterised protein [Acidipropionibacterium jensenii]|uniref:Scaffolding protein n=1 Tax=Acidipropionibacterium jensenii TaxID=1749 RepID=A0A448P0K2_9ACTN|nr:hypothetical protein [Acidipropionibacterium jensenii]VEI03741.1 Uncharacterised protein [Acidipropionibacterium jensenii]